ncbi:hypothetical protein C5167_010500 [Papaver somniferum]|uniref:Uncharacterized protein n=1 Tax=Papaver somniferum TaxID=3469 RepID=A0A4Y7K0F9_PAPSO|nr:hypothetical protein C5167_010500 [Papaver somniferum]
MVKDSMLCFKLTYSKSQAWVKIKSQARVISRAKPSLSSQGMACARKPIKKIYNCLDYLLEV